MRKKIVHDPYVFAGPLPPALPLPLGTFLPFGHSAAGPRAGGQRVHVAPGHLVRMAGASMAGGLGSFGSFGSWF